MTLKDIRNRNPYWSSYTCFMEWARGKKIIKTRLKKTFLNEVDKGDYSKDEIEEILDSIMPPKATKCPIRGDKQKDE